MYPRIKVGLLTVEGRFSPPLIEWLSRELQVPKVRERDGGRARQGKARRDETRGGGEGFDVVACIQQPAGRAGYSRKWVGYRNE